MKNFFLFLFLCCFCISGTLSAQNSRAARRKTAKAGAELSAMAREIRVSRRARERLEDYAVIMDYAIKHEQLNPNELRKIKGIMDRIEKMLDRVNKAGTMSVSEAQTINKELSKAYRTLWFLRRNKLGKNQKLVFLGRNIELREEYLGKFEKGSLNQKEMQEILHTYYSACRVREQLRTDNLKEKHRARLERECFEILSEYFTLMDPLKTEQGPEKK